MIFKQHNLDQQCLSKLLKVQFVEKNSIQLMETGPKLVIILK